MAHLRENVLLIEQVARKIYFEAGLSKQAYEMEEDAKKVRNTIDLLKFLKTY